MSTPVYDFDVKSTGWARCYVTLAPGVAMNTVALDGVDTQFDVMNRHVDKSVQKGIITARITAKGRRRLLFDPPPLAAPAFTPVWPAASVSFSDAGVLYKATLPAYADVDRWIYGPLAIEQAMLIIPTTTDGKLHPLIQVVFDVCSFNDGSTVVDITGLNSRDTPGQKAVTLSALTVTLGANRVYGPEEHLLYEGQAPIWRGSVGSYLEARIDPPTQMFYDAGLSDVLSPLIADDVYPPPDDTAKPGGFWDLTYSMPAPGGRLELGPRTNPTASYLVHHGDSQWTKVVKHGELAGSWCGALRMVDGQTTIRLSENPNYQPKSINGEYAYYMLQAAHLPSLAFWPLLLTGRRCFERTLKDWASTIAWRIYDDPAQSTKSYSTVDIPYGRRVGGRLCMIGAEFNAEVRGWGRGLLAFIDAAVMTPDRETADKAYFSRLVVENISWLDEYALLPGKGHFNVAFSEFDPGDGQGYGAVHPNFASISYWQQMELVASLRHASRLGFPTTFALMKCIVGSFAAMWNEAPEADYPLLASFYYPRVASVAFPSAGIGAHTTLDSWPAISQANYYGASDSHDIGGPNAGPPYYFLPYLYLGYEARRFDLAGADKLITWLKPRAEGQIPGSGAYGYADPSGSADITPPPAITPDAPPPVVTPPQGTPTRTLTLGLSTTQAETNVDPSTLSYRISVPVVVPTVAHPQTRVSYATTDGKAVLGPFSAGQLVPLKVIANNVGTGDASGVTVTPDIQGGAIIAAESPDFDVATGVWHVGALPHSTPDTDRSKHIDVTVKVQP